MNPFSWVADLFGSEKAAVASGGATTDLHGLGPWEKVFGTWEPRMVNPFLLEAMREAVPPLDGAIDAYVTLDGIIRVEAASDRLQRQIQDFVDNVQVGDMQHGLQAYYEGCGNEVYEQGFVLSDYILREDGRDLVRLEVADSKTILWLRNPDTGLLEAWRRPKKRGYRRQDGLSEIEKLLNDSYNTTDNYTQLAGKIGQAGYTRVDMSTVMYDAHRAEAGNPYGTSLIRSLPYLSQTLVRMNVALQQVWSRFGDPMFHIAYHTGNARLDSAELERRRAKLGTDFETMLKRKRNGNSADFVTATGKDDKIEVEVIGGDQTVLEIEQPARHVLEQMVSKLQLPSWMLGFHWSTAERLADKQSQMVLQASKTRFINRKYNLTQIIKAALRARGVTWKDGDWDLVQDLPNISDMLAEAQANFLNTQAEQMRSQASGGSPPEDDTGAKVTRNGKVVFPTDDAYQSTRKQFHAHKESFVEDDPELPKLERASERSLVVAWRALADDTLKALGLNTAIKEVEGEVVFTFDPGLTSDLLRIMEAFIEVNGGQDAKLTENMFAAWLRGVANAADELDGDEVTEAIRNQTAGRLSSDSLLRVQEATVRAYREDIIAALNQGAYDGMNPDDVARELRKRFGAHEYNWRRMARTEISEAQFNGKLAQYAEHGVEEYDWLTAPDACPICVNLAASGPYLVGAGPTPRNSSHPECRCTVEAHIND